MRLQLSIIYRGSALAIALGLFSPMPAIAQLPAQTTPEPDTIAPSSPSVNPAPAVPLPAPLSTPTPSASNTPADYLLGPGDRISISVYGYEEFTGEQVILPDGTIGLQIIGALKASEQTVDQLKQELTNRLQEYLVNPVVTVNLLALRPIRVNVAGEVQRPGPVQLASVGSGEAIENASQAPMLTTALVQAGGVTQNADIRKVTLKRALPNGEYSTRIINLWDALLSENAPQDLVLRDGDSVLVPQLPTGETIDRRLISRSSLAPATVRVRVVGEVKQPGEIQIPPNSSVSSAVAIAGGPTENARLSQVAFIRMNDSGEIEREIIDLRNMTDLYQIQEGDVVIVPERSESSFLNFVARLINPFDFLVKFIDRITLP